MKNQNKEISTLGEYFVVSNIFNSKAKIFDYLSVLLDDQAP